MSGRAIEILFGTHPIAAALASRSRTFERVTLQLGDDARGDASGARALAPHLRARQIPVVRAERMSGAASSLLATRQRSAFALGPSAPVASTPKGTM